MFEGTSDVASGNPTFESGSHQEPCVTRACHLGPRGLSFPTWEAEGWTNEWVSWRSVRVLYGENIAASWAGVSGRFLKPPGDSDAVWRGTPRVGGPEIIS